MSSPGPKHCSFELTNYLEERAANASFMLVEFGHGNYPVVDLQPHEFKDGQCYIGIEAGMRNQNNQYHQKRTSGPFTNKNAFFLQHYLGAGEITQHDALPNDQSYHGEYRTETVLPAGKADEVVASNVFCDPLIAESEERTVNLLQEISRVLSPNGIAVLRETITPTFVTYITAESLGKVGLQELVRVTPGMKQQWRALEGLYGIARRPDLTKGYYSILGRTTLA